MNLNSIETILEYSRRIKNTRTFGSVANHTNGEVAELNEEIFFHIINEKGGKDGVLGEAVDVILCCVDLIYMQNPKISAEEIHTKMLEKLNKWETLYGNA